MRRPVVSESLTNTAETRVVDSKPSGAALSSGCIVAAVLNSGNAALTAAGLKIEERGDTAYSGPTPSSSDGSLFSTEALRDVAPSAAATTRSSAVLREACQREASKGGKGGRGQKRRSPGENRAEGRGVAERRATKGGSSGVWMKRHLKDPYVSAAVEAGAPSRAAFKLVEMNDKHGIISPGDRGGRGGGKGGAPCLPPPLPEGAGERGGGGGGRGGRGVVVAVDLLGMEALPGVEVIRGDFRDARVVSHMFSILSRQRSRGNPAIAETTSSKTGDNDRTTCALREEGPSSAGGGGVYGDGGGNSSSVSVGLSEAFRLRGSSSSGMLLPRPPPPSTDSLDDLFGAAGATATPVVEAEMVEAVGGRVEKGVGAEPLRRKPEPMRRANVVLSDMAPSFSGDRDIDQARVATLVLDSLAACLGDEGGRLWGAPGVGKGGGGGGDKDGGGGGVSGSDIEVGVGEDGGGAGGWDGGVGCAGGVSAGGDRGGVSVGGGGGDVVGGGGGVDRGSGDSVIGSGGGGGGGCRSGGERWGGGGLLARGGTFLGKFFAGRDEGEVKREAERLFERVKVVKPPASRSSSGEMYLLATGFLSGARTGKKEAEK
eukprot:jgi/Undpi1/257/HiC_scaffold_1.g00254.m1